jgi:hypothetical protein
VTTTAELERDDPGFVKDLKESETTVWIVARFFQQRGENVTVRGRRIRDDAKDRHEFADRGDLEIQGRRVEVKRRGIPFTGPSDFPFPSIIVDVAHTWDNADPKPALYMIVNQAGTVAARVNGSTHPTWTTKSRYDGRLSRERLFYECPIDHVAAWVSLVSL